ncbi:MAG: MMPL family transporter [Thermomicrobiales bacterium]
MTLYAVSAGAVSRGGNVAALAVTLDEIPYGPAALAMVPGVRQSARDAAAAAGLGRDAVLVGGETATAYDTRAANDRDTLIVLPLILLAIGVILGLLLRSVVAPLYLLATIVLSYAATLGISTFVFITVLGQEGVSGGTPFFLFVFLVALGVDYNIFLMVRIREETGRHGLETGTRRALGRTGGVITSAGLILAGTFGALMTLPLQDLFQLGFSVALGVLLDTFIIRSLMVPAIVLLLGRWNWWPGTVSTTGAAEPAGD